MSVKTRILEFIEEKGISKRQFYAQTGIANGTLDKVDNIGTDKVEKIYNTYPEINLVWLITGNGNMLQNKSVNSTRINTKTEKINELLQPNETVLPTQEELFRRLLALELDVQLLKKAFRKEE